MTISELKEVLKEGEDKSMRLLLPNGVEIPSHFHVTEVGYVRREFVDCGGTVRVEGKCLLQIWVANDVDHRVSTGKLRAILEHGRPVLPTEALPIEIEYDSGAVSHYPLESCEVGEKLVTLQFKNRQTDCLAKDVCGVSESEVCEPGSGCC